MKDNLSPVSAESIKAIAIFRYIATFSFIYNPAPSQDRQIVY